MGPRTLYRIGAGLLAFFGVAHTFGMLQKSSAGPAVDGVVASMQAVRFNAMGSMRSVYDFYFGFGILLTIYLLFTAVMAWQLGRLATDAPAAARALAWPFALLQVAVAVMSWVYFFLAPQIVSSLAALCAIAAALKLPRS